MRTIEDKLQNREEVVSRRRMLEAMLACMEKLDLAEEVVLFANQAAQANGGAGTRRKCVVMLVIFSITTNTYFLSYPPN